MVATILLWIGIVLLGSILIVLFAPLRASLQFSLGEHGSGGSLVASFFHPKMVRLTMDFPARDVGVRLFGWSMGHKGGSEPEETGTGTVGSTAPTSESDGAPDRMQRDDHVDTPAAAAPAPMDELPKREDRPAVSTSTPSPDDPQPSSFHPSSGSGEPSPRQPPAGDSAPPEETLAGPKQKKDNWFVRLQRNRYVFFIRNTAWRGKVLHWLVRVVRTLFSIVRFDRFTVAVRAGTEDPMLTGTISGLHRAVCGAIAVRPPYAVSFEPVFMRTCFEGTGAIGMRTSMALLLRPLVVALVTFPTLHTLLLWWRFHRREQQWNKEHNR